MSLFTFCQLNQYDKIMANNTFFQGLSNFDKVVGGLVWCIEVCNVDIDIDLLFQEDLSIGKKISLTVRP